MSFPAFIACFIGAQIQRMNLKGAKKTAFPIPQGSIKHPKNTLWVSFNTWNPFCCLFKFCSNSIYPCIHLSSGKTPVQRAVVNARRCEPRSHQKGRSSGPKMCQIHSLRKEVWENAWFLLQMIGGGSFWPRSWLWKIQAANLPWPLWTTKAIRTTVTY